MGGKNSKRGGFLHVVEMSVPSDRAADIEALLDAAGIAVSLWQRAESRNAVFQSFHETAGAAASALRTMRGLPGCGDFPTRKTRIRNKDWQEAWKVGFKTERISRRIIIKPSWRKLARQPKGVHVIELDPGMSFGTGRHFTTRFCLRMIDRLGRGDGASFCDIGCGSGVLSIAAAKLGYGSVTAVDNDPTAAAVARGNSRRNGVGRLMRCVVADVGRLGMRRRFQFVAANLDAPTLQKNAAGIVRLVVVSAASRLIITGVVPNQYPAVKKAFAALGMVEALTRSNRQWIGACLRWRRFIEKD